MNTHQYTISPPRSQPQSQQQHQQQHQQQQTTQQSNLRLKQHYRLRVIDAFNAYHQHPTPAHLQQLFSTMNQAIQVERRLST